MLAASDRVALGRRQSVSLLATAAILLALSACSLPFTAVSPPPPTQTPRPPLLPSPMPLVLRSDELYPDESEQVGARIPSFGSLPAGAVLPPAPAGESERDVMVALDARTVLRGELYQFDTRLQPGILVLGTELGSWGRLPLQLAEAGFVVLVLKTETSTQARHVETSLQSLIAVSGVDAGKIGVIGEARSADIALIACAVNSLCDAVALLSPVSRETSLNLIPSFGDRPLLIVANRADAESFEIAAVLSRAAQGEVQLIETHGGVGAAMLLSQPDLADLLVDWFARRLGRP